jgi:hypothetical protein
LSKSRLKKGLCVSLPDWQLSGSLSTLTWYMSWACTLPLALVWPRTNLTGCCLCLARQSLDGSVHRALNTHVWSSQGCRDSRAFLAVPCGWKHTVWHWKEITNKELCCVCYHLATQNPFLDLSIPPTIGFKLLYNLYPFSATRKYWVLHFTDWQPSLRGIDFHIIFIAPSLQDIH